MTHVHYQPRSRSKRAPISTFAHLPVALRRAIDDEANYFGVSRSFVITTALGLFFEVDTGANYMEPNVKERKAA